MMHLWRVLYLVCSSTRVRVQSVDAFSDTFLVELYIWIVTLWILPSASFIPSDLTLLMIQQPNVSTIGHWSLFVSLDPEACRKTNVTQNQQNDYSNEPLPILFAQTTICSWCRRWQRRGWRQCTWALQIRVVKHRFGNRLGLLRYACKINRLQIR